MKRRLVRYIAFACVMLLVPLAGWMYLILGRTPSGEQLERLVRLPNYHDGRFHNDGTEGVTFGPGDAAGVIVEYLRKPPLTRPSGAVPSYKSGLQPGTGAVSVVWLGHSSYLIQSQGYTVLVDPVLCGYAGPFPFWMKAFPGSDAYGPDDLPRIDLLVISHDHFDHLDYETVMRLKKKTGRVLVPAGVGDHFTFWGAAPSSVTELVWNETAVMDGGISITAVPARHLSGRGLSRDRTLWASFVLKIHGRTLFLGGDGGCGGHFSEIGRAYGPFDLAMMECGRYNRRWPSLHMLPEETVRAAIDLRARMVLPVHWAKFESRSHQWNEPVRRLLREADLRGVRVTVPMIGEPYAVGAPVCRTGWWETD